jgi:iron-sulfur cluster assembly accessory protein
MEITKSAVEQFKKMLKDEGGKDSGVRISVSGGCCGATFGLAIAEKAEKGDKTLTQDGIKLFLSKEAEEKLSAATIDSTNKGFTIRGLPSSGSSCC